MKISIGTFFVLLVVCSFTFAEDYMWNNSAGGIFNDPSKWSPNGVPGSEDSAFFKLPATYTVTFDDAYSNKRMIVDDSNATLDLGGYTYSLDYFSENSRAAVIGEYGQGSLQVNNGIVNSRETTIGQFEGSSGSLTLSGAATSWTMWLDENWYAAWIGEYGNAHLSVLDDAEFRFGNGWSALGSYSNAVVDVNGTDSEWYVDGQFDMSVYGNTTVNINNGGLVNIGKLTMGLGRGSSAQINVNGVGQESELQLHAVWETSLTVAQNGRAAVRLYASKLWNQGTMIIGENSGSYGVLELHEGTLADCPNSVAVGGSFEKAGGVGQIKIIDDTPGNEIGVRFEPTRLAGQYIKVWPQGKITMDGGEFVAEYGSGVANPIILQGGTLEGHGMIWAHVENRGGLVVPWDEGDNKKLEIGYNYSQDAAGTLKIAIAGTDPVTQYAHLQVTHPSNGQVSLDGMLDVDLINGFVPNYDDIFTIIAAQNISGTFSNAVSKYVFEGGSFDVIYNTEDYDSVILTHYSPEPSCPRYPRADLNKDCRVNLLDFAIFAAEWLECGIEPVEYCDGEPLPM